MEDSFLRPFEQITKAKPSKNLYSKIEATVFENKVIPLRTISLVAASILLLLFVNIYVVKNSKSIDSISSDNEYSTQVINDFQIY